MLLMAKIVDGKVKVAGRTLRLRKPVKSWAKNKKKAVAVRVPGTDTAKIVHFGHTGYQDYTQHGSKKRRKNYLRRSAGIRDKSGRKTASNPLSANYWSRNHLW